MRNLTKLLMIAGLAFTLFVSMILAQTGQPTRPAQMKVDEAMVLKIPSVQDDALKLTEDQKAKLKKISDKNTADMKGVLKKGQADPKVFAKAQEDSAKATTEFIKDLTPQQIKRLKQITLQASLLFGLDTYTKDEVQTELKMTDEQKDRITNIAKELKTDSEEIRANLGRDPMKRQQAEEKIEGLTKEAAEQITGIFTEEQKKTWAAMLGEKFDVKRQDLQLASLTAFAGLGKDVIKGFDKESLKDAFKDGKFNPEALKDLFKDKGTKDN